MNENNLEELLKVAKSIEYGEIPKYQHCETFTSGAFDLILVNKRGGEAFDLLSKLCQKYPDVKKDKKHLTGFIILLEQVAYLSNTTELPDVMAQIIDENPSLAVQLKKHYRIIG